MGCIHSRPSDEDVVRRFRARKRFMKQAVMHRQAFATAHYAYLYALRNTGAALRQFAEGESVKDATISNAGGSHGLLEPPPPPPPGLLSSSSLYSPSAAATSAPAGANIRDEAGSASTSDAISPSLTSSSGQRDGSAADTWSPGSSSKRSETPPPPSPQKSSSWDFLNPFRPSSPPFQLINDQRKSNNRARGSTGSFYAGESASNSAAIASFEEDEEDAYRRHSSAVERWEHNNREAARTGGDKDLLDMVKELDEWFLKASSSGTAVSKVLETRKGHFLAVFPEIKKSAGVGHSSHMFSSLPWNWSKTTSASTEDLDKVVDSDSMGSHALTLERLCAWEKKLFNEVKSGEALRNEHQKKCTLLRHQEAKGEDSSVVDKNRAAIKRLHSLILVASQAVESTTAAIKKLRDEELYPQLVELAQGLTYMWRVMHECHAQQKQVARQFKNLDALMASREGEEEATTEYHRHATVELEKELSNWYDCFCKLVASHREYITALNGWARLSVLDASMLDDAANKENEYNSMMMQQQQEYSYDSYTAQYTDNSSASVPVKPATPRVLRLCEEWQKAMDRLPDKVASEAIKSLVAVVHALVVQQAEELRQKKKTERLSKRLEKKLASLQTAERKQSEAPPPAPATSAASKKPSQPDTTHESEYQEYSYPYYEEESLSTDESERMTEDSSSIAAYQGAAGRDPLVDRKAEVDALRKKLEEQRLKHAKCVQDTRVLTMNSLQTGLPGVFEAMTGFSAVCGQAFQALCDGASPSQTAD